MREKSQIPESKSLAQSSRFSVQDLSPPPKQGHVEKRTDGQCDYRRNRRSGSSRISNVTYSEKRVRGGGGYHYYYWLCAILNKIRNVKRMELNPQKRTNPPTKSPRCKGTEIIIKTFSSYDIFFHTDEGGEKKSPAEQREIPLRSLISRREMFFKKNPN